MRRLDVVEWRAVKGGRRWQVVLAALSVDKLEAS